MTFVIRSMTTTDANQREPIRPYHIFLRHREDRASAWWGGAHEAMRFDTEAAAQAEIDRCAPLLERAEIAPVDADALGLPTFWQNREARRRA